MENGATSNGSSADMIVLKDVTKIFINLNVKGLVQFQIITLYHNVLLPAYVDRVARFRNGTATSEGLFDDLGVPNHPETERPTGVHTPGTGAIYLKKRVGEGGYGVVDYFWNVSTGEEYALKKPSKKARRKGMVNADAWRHEAFIMGLISRPPHVCAAPAYPLRYSIRSDPLAAPLGDTFPCGS